MVDWQPDESRGHGPRTLPSRPAEDVSLARRGVATFGERGGRTGWQNFALRYGWRAYALPVLVVITVLALLTAGNGTPQHKPGAVAAGANHPAPPLASGNTAVKSDRPGVDAQKTALKSAQLPPGPAYTKAGDGTFRVLPGASPVVGKGQRFRYDIEVENGITGIDLKQYANLVQSVLADKRSWAGHGDVALQRVDKGTADFHVSLVSAMTVRKLCGYDIPIETSCYITTDPRTGKSVHRVVINDARWVRGDAAYLGDVNAYRIYLINHEDGHATGHQHAHQCLPGGLAPVMMQQTIGLKSAVTGQMCQANPWPYPTGAAGAPGAEGPDTPQNSEAGLNDGG